MGKDPKKIRLVILGALAVSLLATMLFQSSLTTAFSNEKVSAIDDRAQLPVDLKSAMQNPDSVFHQEKLTIIPELQTELESYLNRRGNPIAGLVVVDAFTGKILALVQGKDPGSWGAAVNTNIHAGFPAASLFKTVVSAAAIEVSDLKPDENLGLVGGCADVRSNGSWMRKPVPGYHSSMNLRRAYGQSCNGFFAKLAVGRLGMGSILEYANRFGWNSEPVPADFYIPPSPFYAPNVSRASIHTVGRFAAGFGYVGISTLHAAWQMLAIANDGVSQPLQLFRTTQTAPQAGQRVVNLQTVATLRSMMDATVMGGTAGYAFKRGAYRQLRRQVGGKTGTLTGDDPEGITTWFAGMMPIEKPEVIVAAVVMLKDRWVIKAPQLAAEAFVEFVKLKKKGYPLRIRSFTAENQVH